MTREQFHSLSIWGKIGYVIRRFTWDAALGIFLIAAIGTLIYEDHFKEQPVMQVDMINVNTDSTDGEAFEEFLAQQGLEGQTVKVDKRFQFDNGPGSLSLIPDHLLTCNLSVGKTDVFFWNTASMEQMLAERALIDLRYVLPQEFLMENEDRLIYTGPLLDGGFPCGISLVDNEWVRENNYYTDCAVGISRTADNQDLTGEFLQYIS